LDHRNSHSHHHPDRPVLAFLTLTANCHDSRDESVRLLAAAVGRNAADPPLLHDEACVFLALTYVAQGRAVEATGVALTALAPRLTRYRRSVTGNAAELIEDPRPGG
jgi:tetratricopeptide repeat protein